MTDNRFLFASRYGKPQPVFSRWQGTGGKCRKGARRTIGIVEIEANFPVDRSRRFQEATGTITEPAARPVTENEENLSLADRHREQLNRLAVHRKHGFVGHAHGLSSRR